MFRTMRSRAILTGFIVIVGFHSLFLLLPATQGVSTDEGIIYGWPAAWVVLKLMLFSYAVMGAVVLAIWGLIAWVCRGTVDNQHD